MLAALDNALILVSGRKKSRHQCNTKTRSASIAICVLEKCLVHEKVFLSLLFLSGSKRFLKTTKKKSTFLSIRESLRRKKIYFGRFAKVSAPKVDKIYVYPNHLWNKKKIKH